MLDRLPAWVRHLAIIFGAVSASTVAQAVVDADGVSTVQWSAVTVSALDKGAVAVALAALVLWLTPATRQYGVGRTKAGDGEGGEHDDLGNP